jgi:hypothetical protein
LRLHFEAIPTTLILPGIDLVIAAACGVLADRRDMPSKKRCGCVSRRLMPPEDVGSHRSGAGRNQAARLPASRFLVALSKAIEPKHTTMWFRDVHRCKVSPDLTLSIRKLLEG